ncbi:hypothetical protein ACIRU8_12190 [Streptomyces sp. NPDC101175]|uniref:hypothetical protein n=1 Tax=Streptomyces sp. NPDC101175 TaxID=3366123 RepID=UPI003838D384
MNSGLLRRTGLGLMTVAALVVGVTGCRPTPSHAAGVTGSQLRTMTGTAAGAACVFVKPDGAQKLGHVGWGFRVTGTDTWEYGAVENPSNRLYTPPGGDIGAWHTTGSYARMLGRMTRGEYSRYRCTGSSTSDVTAARAMVRQVERRGFLVGVDPRTGELTSRDCLDATYDVLRAYRTRHLTPAPRLYIPNVWVETLVLWSDRTL